MIPHERAPVKHGKRKRRAAMALADRCAALKCGGACRLFFAGQAVPGVAGGSARKMLFAFFLKGQPTWLRAGRDLGILALHHSMKRIWGKDLCRSS